jgi:hypothetical protein
MKLTTSMCRSRWFLAVTLGLGIGFAMSASLGPGVGFAIGGGIAVVFLTARRDD